MSSPQEEPNPRGSVGALPSLADRPRAHYHPPRSWKTLAPVRSPKTPPVRTAARRLREGAGKVRVSPRGGGGGGVYRVPFSSSQSQVAPGSQSAFSRDSCPPKLWSTAMRRAGHAFMATSTARTSRARASSAAAIRPTSLAAASLNLTPRARDARAARSCRSIWRPQLSSLVPRPHNAGDLGTKLSAPDPPR